MALPHRETARKAYLERKQRKAGIHKKGIKTMADEVNVDYGGLKHPVITWAMKHLKMPENMPTRAKISRHRMETEEDLGVTRGKWTKK
jgi:hypothetical protein